MADTSQQQEAEAIRMALAGQGYSQDDKDSRKYHKGLWSDLARTKWKKSSKGKLEDTPEESEQGSVSGVFYMGIGGSRVTGITGTSDWDIVSSMNWVNYNCSPGIAVGDLSWETSSDQLAYAEYYRLKNEAIRERRGR